MTNPDGNNEVRVSVSVAAPVERAFEVFTEQYHKFWPSSYRLGEAEIAEVVMEPSAGGAWYEITTDGKRCRWGRILGRNAPGHIALGWQITPEFAPEPDEGRASRVDVRFTAHGPDRSTVTLIHSELERHGENWRAMREGVANAWPAVMETYAKVVETYA